MRLFVAIELPEDVKDYVISVSEKLSSFKELRFVKPEHMHLTLDFLGEIDDSELDSVKDKLKSIIFSTFTLKTMSFGFFPTAKKIRVLWLGLERNEYFIGLQQEIRNLFNHKDKFMPHITVARARDVIIRDAHKLNEAMNNIEYRNMEFKVEKFILFKSELMPEGPAHSKLEEYLSTNKTIA
jgi:RNA 2',3'-cyclic 3'-phosphodiesterase